MLGIILLPDVGCHDDEANCNDGGPRDNNEHHRFAKQQIRLENPLLVYLNLCYVTWLVLVN